MQKLTPAQAQKAYRLKTKYNITLEEYKSTWKQQDGVCAICKRGFGMAFVDKGKVLRLLCILCRNLVKPMRYAKERGVPIKEAAEYVECD